MSVTSMKHGIEKLKEAMSEAVKLSIGGYDTMLGK